MTTVRCPASGFNLVVSKDVAFPGPITYSWREMRLRSRLLVGYGVTLGLILVVVAWAVANLVQLGQASDAILRENYASILAAENMIDAVERQDSAILLVMLGFDDEGLRQFRSNEAHFLQWLGRAKDNITIDGEEEILNRIETEYAEYLIGFTLLRERRFGDDQEAGLYYHDEVLPVFLVVRDHATRLRELNQETMFAASAQAERVASRAIWSTLVVAVAAVVLGLVLSLLLSRRLTKPIRNLMRATEQLAEGDYEIHVEAHGADELVRLAQTFNEMTRKLGSYHEMNMERMVAEQRRSDAVLQSIEDGMVVVDDEYNVVNMNRQAARILDVNPNEAIDAHVLEILPSDKVFNLVKASAESGERPEPDDDARELTVERDGSTLHYECSVTPVKSASGAVLGVVLLLRDVTRMKAIDEMKSAFLMTASHELKTPLQSLGMSIELLREQSDEQTDEQRTSLIEAASEEVARLKSLVSDLLDLSKIESGKMELDVDSVPVDMLVEKAISLLAPQADEHGTELVTDLPDHDVPVQADPNKIAWVLTNLVGNALRYAESRIGVRAREYGDWAHVSVTDDGEGIPTEHQSRIFEKFVRVPGREASGGTGLGLAICREIVRAHGGTIWVDSAPGEGSTFTFTVPLAHSTREGSDDEKIDPGR